MKEQSVVTTRKVVSALALTLLSAGSIGVFPLPSQARFGFLELKDAEGEVAWRCEGQFQGSSGQGLCIPLGEKDLGNPYNYYRGQIKNGTFSGVGTFVYDNDDRYQGEVQNGRPQGKGMFFSADTRNRYEGNFRNGFFHGNGVYAFGNGDRYVGQFAQGFPHGKGEYTFLSNGEFSHKYVGRFYLGSINGNGIVTNADGSRCTGIFYSNTLTGRATCTYPKGSIFKSYTGEVKNGRPDGRGTVIYTNGKRYSGQFRNGKPGFNADEKA